MTILEDLYYGNVSPCEREMIKGSPLERANRLIIQNEERLAPTLSKQQKELFDRVKESHSELLSVSEREAFVTGYILATRIMVEVMQGLTKVDDI